MRALALAVIPFAALGCARRSSGGGRTQAGSAGHLVLRGAVIAGTSAPSDVEIAGGRIIAVAAAGTLSAPLVRDLGGRFLAPAFIDSHVHLAYLPAADELAAHGVAAAVDLASPLEFLQKHPATPRLVLSGPMLTAPAGYPLSSWGAAGYGLACPDAAAAAAAVDRLAAAGAAVIKIPLTEPPVLDDAAIASAVARARTHQLLVVVHALGDREAARAARLGADILAHTPIEALAASTIDAWRTRAVISTLGAFGGGAATIDNLRRLREAGATVVYGTDLGNTQTAAIDARELALLSAAGLDGAAILAAGTSTPARLWGFTDLGAIAPGKAASLLVLAADPTRDPRTLATPVAVYLDGATAWKP